MVPFIRLVFFFLMYAYVSVFAQKNEGHPNVVFIFVDDLRPELGCYGNKLVKTPNLDRLASESVTLRNHYVQVPTCGASRFSLLTGILPRTKAHLRNDAPENFISSEVEGERPETFIHHLRRNGYHTVGIGKISHSADGLLYPYTGSPEGAKRELPHSWDELLFDSGRWGTGWNAFFGYADGSNRQSMKGNVKPYEGGEVDNAGYVDGLTASLAVDKLSQLAQDGDPFFLGVGFFKPHLPFTASKEYWDLYQESSLPLTPSPGLPVNVNAASFHNSGEFNSYKAGEEHPSLSAPVSEQYARKITHAYYAAVSYVDAQIGQVLKSLEENDLADNTIVVVWGDHGWQLGDHRVWGKHTLSEFSLRSPLIIKVPGMKTAGEQSEHIVSTVDIYPTLMELCNVSLPHATDGRSFAQLVESGKIRKWSDAAYGYFNNGITVRTRQFRLTRYFREAQPVIELYDYSKDPFENHNIAADRPQEVKRLMETLEKGNTGLYGE
jgi:arylsulfatase A-like enzyme